MEVCLIAIYCVQKRAVSNLDVNNVIFPILWALQPGHDVFHFGSWGGEGRARGVRVGVPWHNGHEAAGWPEG